jgi:hypothetical protein
MRRLPTFIFGVVVGGLLIYGGLHYHVINTPSGLHLVPKVNSTLAETYVDVRGWGVAEWMQHKDVAAALLSANRQDLMQSAAEDSLRTGLDRLLPPAENDRR